MSLELRLEGRQSLSMSHTVRDRDIVQDGRTNERKGSLSLELFTSVQNKEDVSLLLPHMPA